MKKVNGLLLAAILMLSVEGYAQSYAESALLFSRTKTAGSARIQALGGAQTALGGDFSSALSNPAGLGMYNRSEFTLSLAQNNTTVNGDYFADDDVMSTGNKDSRSGISLPGLSLVFSSDQNAKNKFLRGTFAVTLSRTNDFNRNVQYSGENTSSSLANFFLEEANGRYPDQFEEDGYLFNTVSELAYNNYIIGESSILDPNNDPRQYFSDITGFTSKPYQRETIQTRGAQNQWSFSYGANFDDRFYLGAGVGVTSLRYESKKSYSESFEKEALDNFKLDETLEIRGSGINLTVGGIVRPVDIVQLGASFSTPTYYNLTDTYAASMRSNWNNFDYYGDGSEMLGNENASTDAVTSEYNLASPWRMNLGATIFLQKFGFLTADIEQVNYSQARYSSQISGLEFGSDNDRIRSLYKSVTNIRVGSEVRFNAMRLRGGYQFMPDPFATRQNGVNRSYRAISGGVGYKSSDFYIDLAVIHGLGKNSYRPYRINSNDSPLLKFNQKSTNLLVTVGFTF